MEAYTFVCYARHDEDFVLDLAARLQERDQQVWLDRWNIGPGDDWDKAIDAALTGCTTLLIVLSPDAVQSDEVRGELRSALNKQKRIIPVLYRASDIPRQLQSTQYLDVADSGEMTDALIDDLARTLRGEPGPRGDRWRDVRKPLAPLSYVSGRLKAVGASAVGGTVLLAATGLLAEASYSRLLGINLSRSLSAVLYSGLQFFITLLIEALVISLPAGLLLLLVVVLGRAGRRWFPATAVIDRLKRALGRPGLLWAGQLAVYVFLFFVSLPVFADLLPLSDVAFNHDLLGARVDTLNEGARHYRAVVLHVGSASLMVAGLEAWRRRLHRKRQHATRSEAVLSLGLALPLYLLVSAELLLLPIGHGLLWLPTRREYSASIVTFKSSVRYSDLRGKSFLLVDLRSTAPDTFYCPQGSKVWAVHEEDIESFTNTITGKLAQLLEAFRPLAHCEVPSRALEEVAR
jgi:hypothetical protein